MSHPNDEREWTAPRDDAQRWTDEQVQDVFLEMNNAPGKYGDCLDMEEIVAFALLDARAERDEAQALVATLKAEVESQRLRIASLEAALRVAEENYVDSCVTADGEEFVKCSQCEVIAWSTHKSNVKHANECFLAALDDEPTASHALIVRVVEMARCADVDGWDFTEEAIADRILKGGGKHD